MHNFTTNAYAELALGPRRRPKAWTTLAKRRLNWIRLLARPVFFFLFSCFSTLGVCPLTLPARANDPCTLPPSRGTVKSNSTLPKDETSQSFAKMVPSHESVKLTSLAFSRRANFACNRRKKRLNIVLNFGNFIRFQKKGMFELTFRIQAIETASSSWIKTNFFSSI